MKTGFSLWELAHREFPVSYTGFGFAVCVIYLQYSYHKVASSNMSRLEAHDVIFRLLMKGIFNP